METGPAGPSEETLREVEDMLHAERKANAALVQEIEDLKAELAKKPREIVREVEKVVHKETIIERTKASHDDEPSRTGQVTIEEAAQQVQEAVKEERLKSKFKFDEILKLEQDDAAEREEELHGEIRRLTVAMSELQAKFRTLQSNLEAMPDGQGGEIRQTLAAAGIELEVLAMPARNVFQRLYLDALERIKRLDQLRIKVFEERAEHLKMYYAREEQFLADIEGLRPNGRRLGAGIIEDPAQYNEPVRLARRVPQSWKRLRGRSPDSDSTASRSPSPVSRGLRIVGMAPHHTDHWWLEPEVPRANTPKLGLSRSADLNAAPMPGGALPLGGAFSRGAALHAAPAPADGMELDPERAWLRPVSAAMPLRPRTLVPIKKERSRSPGRARSPARAHSPER